jgi:hypothetical protein
VIDTCYWCEEPVLAADDRRSIIDGSTGRRRWQHLECAVRTVTGSLAHLNGTCSCVVPGSSDSDPEGMSKRQTAHAAWLR